MITLEQLRGAALRTMIHLSEDELPALLDALQALEAISAALLVQADDTLSVPESTCVASFPEALRPDSATLFVDGKALMMRSATAQGEYFVVPHLPVQKEDLP